MTYQAMNFHQVFLHAVTLVVTSWAVQGAEAAQATAALREISGGRRRGEDSKPQSLPPDQDVATRAQWDALPPQAAAAQAALEAAAVPVLREDVGAEGDRSFAASLVSAVHERLRRGVLPTIGGEDGLHPHTARRIGKGIFCVMLVIFIFCFGCCWDDSEGLSAAVAGRLLKAELWNSRPPLAEAPTLEDLQVGSSDCLSAKLKGLEGPELPGGPSAPGRRLLPAVLPSAAGELPGAAARLAVPLAQLQAATWTADVLGFMGLPVLFARLRRAEDGERFLEVTTTADRQTPLVSISSGLAIRLGGGAAGFGEALGALVPEVGGRCSLVLGGGRVAMAIASGNGNGAGAAPTAGERLAVLQMPGRRKVGTVSCLAANMVVGEEHLEVSVSAGAELDAALVLACALAARAFGPEGWA